MKVARAAFPLPPQGSSGRTRLSTTLGSHAFHFSRLWLSISCLPSFHNPCPTDVTRPSNLSTGTISTIALSPSARRASLWVSCLVSCLVWCHPDFCTPASARPTTIKVVPGVLSLSLSFCRLFTRNGYGSTNTAFSRCRDTCDRQPLRAVRLALGPTSLTRAAPFGYCQHQRTFASIAHSSMPTVPVLLIMGTFLLWFYVVEDALKIIYTFLNPCWLSNV